MQLFISLINQVLIARTKRIDYFIAHPHEVQEKTLQYLVSKAKNTEWGKKYGYKNIRTIADFQRQVPISTYEELFPYIHRLLKGEQQLLWADDITFFSKSSGTTNARSKFIPVTPESLQSSHYKAGKDMYALYLKHFPESKLISGKNLGIGGSWQLNPENPKAYYGDVSALILKNMPWWGKMFLRASSEQVSLMANWEQKIEALIKTTLRQNVRAMSGVPTWTLVLLQRILEYTGKSNILEVWQNMEVFFHGAVSFTPYKALFKTLIPSPTMHYWETYNASEGFFALQDRPNAEDMLLMLDYDTFFEFVPMDEWDNPHAKTLTITEVEPNKNYALLLSNNAGLWRYKIGDTVKFTSVNPYRIKITGRTKHFMNAFGEEVVVENADTALARACELTDALVTDYTAAPIYLGLGEKGGHEWIIEFERLPNNIETFKHILDDTLRNINSDYDAKRHKELALLPPTVHAAPKGTFYQWLKHKNKLGGQHKVPRLSNTREYVEDILGIMQVISA